MQVIESKNALQTIKSFFTLPKFWQLFGFGMLIYMVGLFALIRGDIFYIDDWYRATNGENWNNFSRYIGSHLMRIFQLGVRNADISPFYQLLGMCVIVLSSMWLSFALLGRVTKISLLSLAPLGLSPYFLENFSYRFDAFLMCCAVCFAIIPFGFWRDCRAFFISSVICVFLLLGCYQAANAVFIVIFLFLIFYITFIKRESFKEILRFCLASGSGFILGMLGYRLLLLKPVDTYVSSKMLSISEIMGGGGGGNNLSKYLHLLYSDFTTPKFFIFYLVCILVFSFILCCVCIKDSKIDSKIMRFLGAIVFLILALFLSFGAYLVLEKPLFHPRAFNGIGALVAILLLSLLILESNLLKILKIFNRVLIITFAYGLIVFANAYGNAISAQQEYTKFRAQILIDDLERVAPLHPRVDSKDLVSKLESYPVLVMSGSAGYPSNTRFTLDRYGAIMWRLIPDIASGNWQYFALTYFNYDYAPFLNKKYRPTLEENVKKCKELPKENHKLLLKNSYHAIYRLENCVFITLFSNN